MKIIMTILRNFYKENKEEDKNKNEINEDKSPDNKNEINEIDNTINQEKKISNNTIKKKKGNNFCLYPTVKKVQNEKINKPPFIMELNEDILAYNKIFINNIRFSVTY